MPNWCKNRISFSSEEDLKKCFEILGHSEAVQAQEFSFAWVIPYPDTKEECIKKYGKQCVTEDPEKDQIQPDDVRPWLNWYNFHNSVWGCKWDASEVCIDGSFIYFDSPWSPPDHVIEALAEKLEDIPFTFAYAEEQGNLYCGEFYHSKGCIGDSWNEFEKQSKDSSEMFNELWGETYFICEEDGEYHSDYESEVFSDGCGDIHYFDFTDFSEKNKEQAKLLHKKYEDAFDDFVIENYGYIGKDEQRAKEYELMTSFLKEAIGFYKPIWDDDKADPDEYEVDHEYKFVSSFEEEYADSFES